MKLPWNTLNVVVIRRKTFEKKWCRSNSSNEWSIVVERKTYKRRIR